MEDGGWRMNFGFVGAEPETVVAEILRSCLIEATTISSDLHARCRNACLIFCPNVSWMCHFKVGERAMFIFRNKPLELVFHLWRKLMNDHISVINKRTGYHGALISKYCISARGFDSRGSKI
ncbi:hypothetical protein ONS96_012268 [Cadophora gregata f. sp. sojae]|nr:hypothetical protein ONS96_012268 [Cadophora gregata f. sp. sojae]